MTTIRIRIDKWIIKRLRFEYEKRIHDEHGIMPTDTQIVVVALLELESMKLNQEINIKFLKNGKIYYKFR